MVLTEMAFGVEEVEARFSGQLKKLLGVDDINKMLPFAMIQWGLSKTGPGPVVAAVVIKEGETNSKKWTGVVKIPEKDRGLVGIQRKPGFFSWEYSVYPMSPSHFTLQTKGGLLAKGARLFVGLPLEIPRGASVPVWGKALFTINGVEKYFALVDFCSTGSNRISTTDTCNTARWLLDAINSKKATSPFAKEVS